MSNYRKHGDINTHKQSLSVYYTFPRASINFQENPLELAHVANYTLIDVPFYSSSMYNYLSELKSKAHVLNEKWIYYNSYMWLYLPTTLKNECVSNIPHIFEENIFVHSNIILYEMIEMFSVLHLYLFNEQPTINVCHFGNNSEIFGGSVKYVFNFHGKDVNCCDRKKKDFITIDATCERDNEYSISKTALFFICKALLIQRKRGVLILKIGDCFTKLSLDIIYFLSSFYEKTYFMKPTVSFLASGFRYVICKDFRNDRLCEKTQGFLNTLHQQMTNSIESTFILRILHEQIPVMFSNRLEEINSILGQPRLEYIHQCLTQYEQCNDKTGHTIPNDVRKCVDWCLRFKVPIRPVYNGGFTLR